MKEAIKELFPPGIKPVQRWRLSMFIGMVVTMVHIAWACGWLGYLKLGDGFAYASEVRVAKAAIDDVHIALLEKEIIDLRKKQCEAGNDSRAFYTQRLQELLRKYAQLSKFEYRLPDCREL